MKYLLIFLVLGLSAQDQFRVSPLEIPASSKKHKTCTLNAKIDQIKDFKNKGIQASINQELQRFDFGSETIRFAQDACTRSDSGLNSTYEAETKILDFKEKRYLFASKTSSVYFKDDAHPSYAEDLLILDLETGKKVSLIPYLKLDGIKKISQLAAKKKDPKDLLEVEESNLAIRKGKPVFTFHRLALPASYGATDYFEVEIGRDWRDYFVENEITKMFFQK